MTANTNAALDRFVKSEMKRLSVPGVAVGVLHKGRRYVNGYGVTNADHPLPVQPDTFFQIGSTTKTYTATAVMRLVEQGKLALDVPVRRYVPELRLRDKFVERNVTLQHLLTHTGGWLGDYFADGGRGDDAIANVVAKMAKIKQLTPLGTVWSYNNSGFYIAGRVIEKITKKSYSDAIQELLLDPLGMTNSFFFAEDVLPYRVAVGHVTNGAKNRVAKPWALRRSAGPAGGIVSNAGDQLKWAAFHMGDGKAADGKRVLRKSTLNLMQKPQAKAGSMADSVGISWLISTVGGVKVVAHGGTTNGQLSAFQMVPQRSFAMTVLTNSTSGGQLHRSVVGWAMENYLGIKRPAEPPLRLTRSELAPYAGSYRQESSGLTLQVRPRNGGIVVHLPVPPAPASGPRPPKAPPINMHFVGPDRVTAAAGYYKGTYGEFLRGPRGNITWFRLGGRIQRRVKSE
jgi:CubicO group peptidase (beta-lactamase class C family)